MEALFAALAQYVDYLVLGAISLAVLSLPFGFLQPLSVAWRRLSLRVRRSHTFVQAGLIAGVLFAAFYFSGYFMNAFGHAFLRRAHYSVIDTAATFDPKQQPQKTWFGMRTDFLVRSIPLIGPFLWVPGNSELDSYWRDSARQVYWDVCDAHSFDDMTGGGIIKELRLLRGLAGLTQVLLVMCVLASWLSRRGYLFVPNQRQWAIWTFVSAVIIYEVLILPAYWDAEYDEHSTLWAAFPRQLTLTLLPPLKLDDVLPCAKLKIVSEGNKRGTGHGEEDKTKPGH